MLQPDQVELLEAGCGLVIGFVTPSGAPFVTRGWGLDLSDNASRARVLVGAATFASLGYPPGGEIGTMMASTGCNVLSLKAVQLKGPITDIHPADDRDLARLRRYCTAFFDDVNIVDNVPRRLMERLVPTAIVVCEFDVVETYDQTPGPNAGAQLGARAK